MVYNFSEYTSETGLPFITAEANSASKNFINLAIQGMSRQKAGLLLFGQQCDFAADSVSWPQN